jgi:hypothetical protein
MSPQNNGPQSNPLTDDHYQVISNVLQGCSVQEEILGLCTQAGLDVSKYVTDNNRRKQLAAGLKKAFFPNNP